MFLALYPKENGILDSIIFRKDLEISIAGIYKETRTERLDEMNYPYSFFEIVDFHLWEEPRYYPAYYPYPYEWYDPWYATTGGANQASRDYLPEYIFEADVPSERY